MPSQRIVFINKSVNSSSIGRSTHQERRKINENNREYRKVRHVKLSTALRSKDNNGSNHAQASTTNVSTATLHQLIDVSSNRKQKGNSQPGLAEVIPRMPSSTTDPFSVSSVPLNTTVLQILRYYVQVYHGTLWRGIDNVLNPTKDGRIIVRCSPEKVVLECMTKSMRMNCLLANVGTRLAVVVKQPSEIDPMQLIQRGTRSLREAFIAQTPNVDNEILLGSLHLYLAVKALKQAEAIKAHSAGVNAIITKLREDGSPITVPCAALIATADVAMARTVLQHISEHSEEHFSRAPCQYVQKPDS